MQAPDNSRGPHSPAPPIALPMWLLLAALAAGTVSLSYPVLRGGFLNSVLSSQYTAGYAFRDFAAQSLRSGHGFPQWNPFMFGGAPFAGATHDGVFYPTFLLRLLMPTDLAITWGFITHEFLAGALTLGFLRASGLSRLSATLGALAYMMSGPLASTPAAGDDGTLFVSALLPGALWMLVRAINGRSLASWGMFALLTGASALAGDMQLFAMFVLVCMPFALLLLWWPGTPRAIEMRADGLRGSVAMSVFAMCAVLAGVAVSAIQNWPAWAYFNNSTQAALQSYELATMRSLPPEELINTYLPQFSGILTQYWGRGSSQLHSAYLGVVVLLLAPLSFGAGVQRNVSRFFAGVAGLALLWSLGSFTPFFHVIYALVPGAGYFRTPASALVILAFACSVLAAFGLERLLAHHVERTILRRYLIGWGVFALVVCALAFAGTITGYAQELGRSIAIADGHDLRGYANFIETNGFSITYGAVRNLGMLLVVAATIVTLQAKRIGPHVAAVVICGTCAADLWITTHRYWQFSEPASALYRADPIVDFLKQQSQPGRVFVYTKTADYRTATDPYYGSSGFGDGGGFMVHSVRTVAGAGMHPLARYDAISSGMAATSPAFWQHENVRWLYTNVAVTDTLLQELVGRTSNAANSRAYLYAMPGHNPYAWVANTYGVRSDAAALRELFSDAYNPLAFVAVAPGTLVDAQAVPTAPDVLAGDSVALQPFPSAAAASGKDAPGAGATTTAYRAGHVTIELDAPATAGSALVLSENYYNGWRAESNGQSLPVMRTAYNLVGTPLPTGARMVSFTFVDPAYITGRAITCTTLLLLLLATGAGAMRDRQTRRHLLRPHSRLR